MVRVRNVPQAWGTTGDMSRKAVATPKAPQATSKTTHRLTYSAPQSCKRVTCSSHNNARTRYQAPPNLHSPYAYPLNSYWGGHGCRASSAEGAVSGAAPAGPGRAGQPAAARGRAARVRGRVGTKSDPARCRRDVHARAPAIREASGRSQLLSRVRSGNGHTQWTMRAPN